MNNMFPQVQPNYLFYKYHRTFIGTILPIVKNTSYEEGLITCEFKTHHLNFSLCSCFR